MKTTLHELDEDSRRKILRYELTYQKAAHPSDALIRKELYLVNKQSVSTMTYNLGVLLGGDLVNEENNGEVFLPTEADVMSIIATKSDSDIMIKTSFEKNPDAEFTPRLNELCSVVWEYKGKTKWYLGFVLDIKDEYLKIEHLERSNPSNDQFWQLPTNYSDIQNVEKDQILPIVVQGDWDYTNDDKCTLSVSNVEEVIKCFNDFV